MQEYSVYFNSSFSIFSLASGACLFIFSGKPNMDTQAIRQIYDTFIVHTLTEDVKVKKSLSGFNDPYIPRRNDQL